MQAKTKEKVFSIVIALFIIQFGLFFIIRATDKKYENQKVEKIRLEKLFGVEFDENLQPKSTILDLSNNNWSEIPSELKTFKSLEKIDLRNNQLKDFPYELLEIPNLTDINLNNNQIKNIRFSRKNTALLSLFINNNQIESIENIEFLNALEILSLNNNRISEMPNFNNRKLITLSLINNQIEVLEDNFDNNLEFLDVSKNQITRIDKKINFLTKRLLELNLSNNKELEYLPNNLLAMSYLRSLNLNNCQLKKWEIKEDLTNLNLRVLKLSFNQLQSFELTSKQLPNLKSLQLKQNKLKQVKIAHQGISKLDLSINQLTTEGLSLNLPFATNVNLYDNELKSLKESCLIAPNLEVLDLNRNYITTEQGQQIWLRFPKVF